LRRVLTAAAGIPLVIAGISFAPAWVGLVVLAALAALGSLEVHRIALAQGIRTLAVVGAAFSALLALSPLAGGRFAGAIAAGAVIAALSVVIFESRPLAEALPGAGATLFGVLWVGLLLSYLGAIHLQDPSRRELYLLLAGVWLGDSGAYYVGRRFGRRKLAPRLSPGKTVEGLLGGIAASLLGIVACWRLLGLGDTIGFGHVLPLGLLIALFAVLGDLAESAIKRGAGVKDSGTLFPGHGGVLDRLDSLLFAAPVMYHYLGWLHPPPTP
jgi:phosphatidate cytidylyltransferase